jgi:hypothetical protein
LGVGRRGIRVGIRVGILVGIGVEVCAGVTDRLSAEQQGAAGKKAFLFGVAGVLPGRFGFLPGGAWGRGAGQGKQQDGFGVFLLADHPEESIRLKKRCVGMLL